MTRPGETKEQFETRVIARQTGPWKTERDRDFLRFEMAVEDLRDQLLAPWLTALRWLANRRRGRP